MLRYYITDRRSIGGEDALLQNVERLGDTVDLIQVREKDLEAGELAKLVRNVLRVAHSSVRVLVNDRADIAMACGAHGVHLRRNGIAAAAFRRFVPFTFIISVSCHGLNDVRVASREGANYALLAPIFQSPGKGEALGLEMLREAVSISAIPVLALGGVNEELIAACADAGAAGFAGIRYFQQPPGRAAED